MEHQRIVIQTVGLELRKKYLRLRELKIWFNFSNFFQKKSFSGLWITKNNKLKISNKNVFKKKIKVGKLEGAWNEIC